MTDRDQQEEVRYEWLRPRQIVARRKACPLAYVPLGTLEWHGLQNPIGLDGLKAHGLCVQAARQGGGLVMPTVFFGEHRESHLMEANYNDGNISRLMELPHENFAPGYMRAGTIIDQANFYARLIWHIGAELHSLGFKAAVWLNGHYPLTHAVRYVGHLLARHMDLRCWAGHEGELLAEYDMPGHGDHAGPWETSLMMTLAPDKVDLSELDPAPDERPVGCTFDPRTANTDFGQEWVDKIAECLVRKGKELLG
ncbi:MAG TPA: creatininase family protein [Phycisphaerae bacterium]|nr:creatininase family protein [Phycisphaerae bacterium]